MGSGVVANSKRTHKYSYSHLVEALRHKRLQLVFWSVLLNKIARNAFYYTFSRWLSESYGLGPQSAGYVTLFVACGCLVGTTIVPLVVNQCRISIHCACLSGSAMQVLAMCAAPAYAFSTARTSQLPLPAACVVIFFYFCGC